MGELLTVDELSEELKVPKSWVYSQTRRKDVDSLPTIKLGKYCRFNKSDVLEWLGRQGKGRG